LSRLDRSAGPIPFTIYEPPPRRPLVFLSFSHIFFVVQSFGLAPVVSNLVPESIPTGGQPKEAEIIWRDEEDQRPTT
jgi:hypothetical protein